MGLFFSPYSFQDARHREPDNTDLFPVQLPYRRIPGSFTIDWEIFYKFGRGPYLKSVLPDGVLYHSGRYRIRTFADFMLRPD
jgi:hypothetical protein